MNFTEASPDLSREDKVVETKIRRGPAALKVAPPTGPMAVEQLVHEGVTYELPLSSAPSEKNGGYVGVVKQGNYFHAKITIFKGDGQTMLPGSGCLTAQDAALKLAMYKAEPYQIEKKNPSRAPKGWSKVRSTP